MAQTLKHKGYQGSVEYDLEDKYLHGKVLFIDDAVIYNGDNLTELEQSFQDAVDGYLELCEEIGKDPQKSCSGTFNVRIPPKLHRQAQQFAFEQGISLNATVERALDRLCDSDEQNIQVKHIENLILSMYEDIQYQNDFTKTFHLQHSEVVSVERYS